MIVLADGSELRSPCLLDGRCLTEEREDARVPARKAGAGGAVQRKYNVSTTLRRSHESRMPMTCSRCLLVRTWGWRSG